MYTDFDNSLGLKSHLGFYVRWGVEVLPHLTIHATFPVLRVHQHSAVDAEPGGSADPVGPGRG